MRLEDSYDLSKIRNITAEKVYRKMEKLIEERDDFCKCENCVLDIVAYTLNHVTPYYATSLIGSLDPKRRKERRIEVEIDIAIEEGIKRVKNHPHHEEYGKK